MEEGEMDPLLSRFGIPHLCLRRFIERANDLRLPVVDPDAVAMDSAGASAGGFDTPPESSQRG